MKTSALVAALALCVGCGPSQHCHRSPVVKQWFTDANWYTVTYTREDGSECADITERETWGPEGYAIFVPYLRGSKNVKRGYGFSLQDAESIVEKGYCAL